jgi:octaprenyl-diphosphate synthase
VKPDPADNLPSATNALSLVAEDLDLVEQRIAEVIEAREPTLTAISDYLINAGGKRIRPAVSMLIFRAVGGRDVTDMVDLSVALELIHTATLLHDDIIDSNDVRRGKQAAPLRFGMADTLVTGDFLFSRAFQVCGRFEERIVRWAAEACVGLTEGEIMQGRYRRNPEVRDEHYLEIIQRKTASLFEAGGRIAAWLATSDEEVTMRLADCGNQIGLAFQMIDDVLDVVGEADRTGKRVGTDLLDGNPSLPVVWGLELPPVRRAFETEGIDDVELELALQALREAGIPARVRDAAVAHATRAREIVLSLADTPYRAALVQLVDDLVDRDI